MILSAAMLLAQAEPFLVTGRYRFEDGDHLVWDCNKPRPCDEPLVRDERLQRELNGDQDRFLSARLTLRVVRVDPCGPLSSQAVCIRGSVRPALRIVEWIAVESSTSRH